jgi:hypothetical protein
MRKAHPDDLSSVERLLYDEIVETRQDVKRIDRRLARVEVKSGFIGALSATAIVLLTKVKMFFAGGP